MGNYTTFISSHGPNLFKSANNFLLVGVWGEAVVGL